MASPKPEVILKHRCKKHAGWPTQKGPKSECFLLSVCQCTVQCPFLPDGGTAMHK